MKNSTIQMIVGYLWLGMGLYHAFVDNNTTMMMLCFIMSSGCTIVKMLYEQKEG